MFLQDHTALATPHCGLVVFTGMTEHKMGTPSPFLLQRPNAIMPLVAPVAVTGEVRYLPRLNAEQVREELQSLDQNVCPHDQLCVTSALPQLMG